MVNLDHLFNDCDSNICLILIKVCEIQVLLKVADPESQEESIFKAVVIKLPSTLFCCSPPVILQPPGSATG